MSAVILSECQLNQRLMRMSSPSRPRYLLAAACSLAASTLALAANAGPPDDLAQKVGSAVSDCLSGSASASPAGSIAPAQPPLCGIGRDGGDLKISHIPTSRGQLYAYHNEQGAEIVCGGPSTEQALPGGQQGVLDQLRASSKFARARLTAYKLSTPAAASSRYFGDSNAPGLYGVLVLQRPEGEDGPTLQVDYHRTLVQVGQARPSLSADLSSLKSTLYSIRVDRVVYVIPASMR